MGTQRILGPEKASLVQWARLTCVLTAGHAVTGANGCSSKGAAGTFTLALVPQARVDQDPALNGGSEVRLNGPLMAIEFRLEQHVR